MITNPVTGQSPDTCNITVTADSEQGSVSGGGKATKGMNVVVQAVENTRYSFSAWKENGSQVATSASYQFTVAKDRDLQATFTEKKKAGKHWQQLTSAGSYYTDVIYSSDVAAGNGWAIAGADSTASSPTGKQYTGIYYTNISGLTANTNMWPILNSGGSSNVAGRVSRCVFGNNVFVVLIRSAGSSHYDVQTFTTGTGQTKQNIVTHISGDSGTFHTLGYAFDKFILKGYHGKNSVDEDVVRVSSDGVTWTEYTSTPSTSAQYSGFIVAGTDRVLHIGGTTSDGLTGVDYATKSTLSTWYHRDVTFPFRPSHTVFGNNKFICVSTDMTQVGLSADGLNWNFSATNIQKSLGVSVQGIAYGAGKFVVTARKRSGSTRQYTNYSLWSVDGLNWEFAKFGSTATYGGCSAPMFTNNKFLCLSGGYWYVSYDE